MEFSNQTLHEILIRIEEKVDKTNGRVSDLEKWKNRLVGAWAVLLIAVVPIVVDFIKSKF